MIDNSLIQLHGELVSIDPVPLDAFANAGLEADALRLDKIHPVISGNKWFKLKEYFSDALKERYDTIITFGGPFSNHIVATACACHALHLSSVGIIRGEQPPAISHSLQTAAAYGMRFEFINRDAYAKKDRAALQTHLRQEYPGSCIIPEGGAGEPGVRGSGDIMDWIPKGRYTHILCAIGTGTMFRGLARKTAPDQQLMGVPVLKISEPSRRAWEAQLEIDSSGPVNLAYDYHFGGYAKKQPALTGFMNKLYQDTGIPTDFVYTGKLFYAGAQLASQKYFPPNSRLLFVHSGGLQGNRSLPPGTLIY